MLAHAALVVVEIDLSRRQAANRSDRLERHGDHGVPIRPPHDLSFDAAITALESLELFELSCAEAVEHAVNELARMRDDVALCGAVNAVLVEPVAMVGEARPAEIIDRSEARLDPLATHVRAVREVEKSGQRHDLR